MNLNRTCKTNIWHP